MNKLDPKNILLGGVFLVTGTCIGAGMLGVPIKTAEAGFLPTIVAFVLVWVLMTISALLMLEVSLWHQEETNLISMARGTIGKIGGGLCWVMYIAFLYSVMAAYTSGGTTIFAKVLDIDLSVNINLIITAIIFMLPFAFCVFLGTKWVDYLNRIFIFGLIISFVAMLFFSKVDTNVEFNLIGNVRKIWFAMPLLALSFGYHLLIPSLKTYMNNDIKKLRLAIIIGGFIPLIIYTVWEYIVLDLVPTFGDNGLISMLKGSGNPADLLIQNLSDGGNNFTLILFVAVFSFLALTSSLIGVALGLFDFLADGFKIKKNKSGKLILTGMTFIPPIIYTLVYPQGFMLALEYGGIFSSILLIIYPALMVWFGRYVTNKATGYKVVGGKLLVLITLGFGVAIIVISIF